MKVNINVINRNKQILLYLVIYASKYGTKEMNILRNSEGLEALKYDKF